MAKFVPFMSPNVGESSLERDYDLVDCDIWASMSPNNGEIRVSNCPRLWRPKRWQMSSELVIMAASIRWLDKKLRSSFHSSSKSWIKQSDERLWNLAKFYGSNFNFCKICPNPYTIFKVQIHENVPDWVLIEYWYEISWFQFFYRKKLKQKGRNF